MSPSGGGGIQIVAEGVLEASEGLRQFGRQVGEMGQAWALWSGADFQRLAAEAAGREDAERWARWAVQGWRLGSLPTFFRDQERS